MFCHNNPWIMIAETELGHGDAAFDLYRKIAPAYLKDQKLHCTEPYVCVQTVNGKESWLPGEARNSWLTGTAAWMFVAASQAILGIKPQFDGLMVDPCLPADVKELDVTRKFRGNEYRIHISNQAGGEKGQITLKVDGQEIDGKVVKSAETGKVICVEAIVA